MLKQLRPIQEFPLFSSLPPETVGKIESLLEDAYFPKGTTLFQYGDPADRMYFIRSGKVKFVTMNDTDQEVTFEEIGAGQFFGEVALLDTQGRRTATAKVTEDVFALALHQENLLPLFRACPEVALLMLEGMAQRLRRSGDQLRHTITSIEIQLENSRTPLEKFLKGIVQQVVTPAFLGLNIIFLVAWIGTCLWMGQNQTSNAALSLLGIILGIESLLITLLVLTNQNRDEKDTKIRDDHERQVNITAEREIRALHQKLDKLSAELRKADSNA